MINTTIGQIKQRRFFYRGFYLKGLNMLLVLLAIEIVLAGVVLYISAHRQIPAFYASSSDGILSPIKAMPSPNLSNKPLLT